MDDGGGILVPMSRSRTLEETVEYALKLARDDGVDLHLVKTASGTHVDRDGPSPDERLLGRVERLVADHDVDGVSVRTELLETDEYVAASADHAEFYIEYMARHGIDRLVVDPEFSFDATAPTLQPLQAFLDDLDIEYELADVGDSDWKPTAGELVRGGVIGVAAFGFYVALGGPTYWFAIWSGVITALIAGMLLRNVAFETTPRLGGGARMLVRLGIFVPSLLWEIAKANVQFAYVVLHPRLPIDPHLDRIEGSVDDGKAVMALANSITLTPGTLAVDADGHHLLVHSLNLDAREDVLDGVHEAYVSTLFYGDTRPRTGGPGARGEAELLSGSTVRDRSDRPSDDEGKTDE